MIRNGGWSSCFNRTPRFPCSLAYKTLRRVPEGLALLSLAMLSSITHEISTHIASFPHHDDHIIFNNKAVKIDHDKFQTINSSSISHSFSKIIAFLDGGQAEIINGGNFCLSFIRVAAQLFRENEILGKEKESANTEKTELMKKELIKKGLIKNDFYLFTKAVWRNNDLLYESSIFPLREGKIIDQNDLTISSYDSSLKVGNERAPITRVASLARRFAELALAQQISADHSADHSADYVVLDGTLEGTFTGEDKYLQQLPSAIAALAKTSSLFTTSGNNPIVLLNKLAPFGCWHYFVDNAKDGQGTPTHQTYFVKLHPQSKHVFRLEGNTEVLPALLPILVEQSQDAVFLGYPYGLILADKLARVSNEERNALRMNFLLRKENKEIVEYLHSTNAHEILDKVG